MDIDPIDGGPKNVKPPPSKHSLTTASNYPGSGGVVPMQVSEEEEARQAIEMLRGDDVSARVAAANRLEAVASVLGEQRTREVCAFLINDVVRIAILHLNNFLGGLVGWLSLCMLM
jgi:hypothetical protein